MKVFERRIDSAATVAAQVVEKRVVGQDTEEPLGPDALAQSWVTRALAPQARHRAPDFIASDFIRGLGLSENERFAVSVSIVVHCWSLVDQRQGRGRKPN
jgi:hypothetical protein